MAKTKLAYQNGTFLCHLECNECVALTSKGQKCKNRVCIGVSRCWMHSKREYGVRIRPSQTGGKGLFATRAIGAGSWICPYHGEVINRACLDQRYPGNTTATYTTTLGRATFNDSACRRGIGSMANGKFRLNGQSQTRQRHNAEIARRPNWVGTSEGSTWLRAIRDIGEGSEVFVYYGTDYRLQQDHKTYRTTRSDSRPC